MVEEEEEEEVLVEAEVEESGAVVEEESNTSSVDAKDESVISTIMSPFCKVDRDFGCDFGAPVDIILLAQR